MFRQTTDKKRVTIGFPSPFMISLLFILLFTKSSYSQITTPQKVFTDTQFGDHFCSEYSIAIIPTATSGDGIVWNNDKTETVIRHRFMADRPDIDAKNNSSTGYNIFNLVLNFKREKFNLGFSWENQLDQSFTKNSFNRAEKHRIHDPKMKEVLSPVDTSTVTFVITYAF